MQLENYRSVQQGEVCPLPSPDFPMRGKLTARRSKVEGFGKIELSLAGF
jgi:hypothetical protein